MITVTISGETQAEVLKSLVVVNGMFMGKEGEQVEAKRNKPGQGRKTGAVGAKKRAKAAAPPSHRIKPAVIAAQKELDAAVVEAEEDSPVDVAEPANKEIMDAFDAEQEANGEVDAVDDLLAQAEAETPPPVSAKNPTYKDVAAVVTQVINKKKAEGKNPVEVVKAVLAGFNIKKVSELPKEQYSHFVQKCRSVM